MKRFTLQLWCHMAGQEQGPAEKVLETALKSVNDAECQILLLGKGGTWNYGCHCCHAVFPQFRRHAYNTSHKINAVCFNDTFCEDHTPHFDWPVSVYFCLVEMNKKHNIARIFNWNVPVLPAVQCHLQLNLCRHSKMLLWLQSSFWWANLVNWSLLYRNAYSFDVQS